MLLANTGDKGTPVTPEKPSTSHWRQRRGLSPSAAHAPAPAAAVVTQPAYIINGVVDYSAIPATVVKNQPDVHLKKYVKYRTDNLPDMTDKIEFKISDLQFWAKNGGKVTKGPDKQLPGMCGKWTHNSVDYAVSKNYHCIKFIKAGVEVDLTVPFIIVMHVVYVSQMHGQPPLSSNASQKVLKYMLSNVPSVVKAWRQRLYNYASATIFNSCTKRLKTWIFNDAKDNEDELNRRTKCLVKLFNHQGLYPIVGAAIMRFIGLKATSFPNAVRSKTLFMAVPAWKRAMIFVRMVRHVLDKHASKHWNNYGYENYKFNVKVFNAYLAVDRQVITSSPNWANLDTNVPAVVNLKQTPKKRKRRRTSGIQFSSPEERKRVHYDCTISSDED